MMRQPSRVVIAGLRKRFGRREVLRGLDLAIAPARITAIVGPNAAGKTTLIKTILGLVRRRPGDGSIRLDGVELNGDCGYRARIGYMPQAARFPEQLTGREILDLVIGLRQRPPGLDRELIERFRLEEVLDQPVRTLSGGTRQKLNAAVAFLFQPTLLILDEPTAGLDPLAAGILKDKVRRAPAEGTTVVLTSHLMGEVEELAQDLIFLLDGTVAYQGSVEGVLARTGEDRLERAMARLLAEGSR
jgi:Cu-processing system ATP-binding protein